MNELELNIGAQVHCQDGVCGKLAKIALEPETHIVTHIVAEEGVLLKRARVFPMSVVERTTPDDIYLSLSSEQMSNYPEFREEIVEEVDPAQSGELFMETGPYITVTSPPMIRRRVRHGVPEDLVVLDGSTNIENLDGPGGKLDSLRVESKSGHLRELTLHHGFIFPEQKRIPIDHVRRVGERAIAVSTQELGISS